jgi:hypothetical protein
MLDVNKLIVMKKLRLVFVVVVLFTVQNSFTQSETYKLSKKNQYCNEEHIDKSPEIVEFLLKYKNTTNKPTQDELNTLFKYLGIEKMVSNKPISKEVVFKLIDFYFNYVNQNQPDYYTNSDDENSFTKNLSYINFRKQIKGVNPDVTDVEIQKVFIEMHHKLKNL